MCIIYIYIEMCIYIQEECTHYKSPRDKSFSEIHSTRMKNSQDRLPRKRHNSQGVGLKHLKRA